MNESAIGTGMSATPDSAAGSSAVDSPSTSSQGSGAPNEQSLATSSAPVQGADQTQPSSDPLAGLPSLEELQEQVKQNLPGAKGMAQLRGAYDQLKPQFSELETKWQTYEPIVSRFDQPEQLQEALSLHDQVIGWEKDPSGELIPATTQGANYLSEKFPLHADYLAADLLNGQTVDPNTGQRMSRMDVALSALSPSAIGNDADLRARRAEALRLLGAVEPSSISPQWQATEEELAVVRPELQEVYKKLPYEERQELKLANPDFINSHLQKEKLMQELTAEREQSQQREQQRIEQREQYVRQQAEQHGETYVRSQLSDALTTFHNSVVEQCNFIQPLDPNNLPQGMSPDQANQMNQQIAASNKAEAAQISGLVIGVVNPETRPFVLPLLKEIGVIDDKMIKQIDEDSAAFGDNGRNFGILDFRGRMTANGNGFQPDASITNLRNNSQQALKRLVYNANQIKSKLLEHRSQFFQLKATDHNQTLNSVQSSRPSPNGSTFNPATAASTQLPVGPMTRKEIDALYG